MPELDADTYANLEGLFQQTVAALDDFPKKFSPAQKAVLLEQMVALEPEQARAFLDHLFGHLLYKCRDLPQKQQEQIEKLIYALKNINDVIYNTPLTMRTDKKITYVLYNADGAVEEAGLEYDQLVAKLNLVGNDAEIQAKIQRLEDEDRVGEVVEILQRHTDAVKGLLAYGFDPAENVALFDTEIRKVAEKAKIDATNMVLSYVQENLDNQGDELSIAKAKGHFHNKLAEQSDKRWRQFEFGNLPVAGIHEGGVGDFSYDISEINQLKAQARHAAADMRLEASQVELEEDLQKIRELQQKLLEAPEAVKDEVVKQKYLDAARIKAPQDLVLLDNYRKAKNAADPDNAAAVAWMENFKKQLLQQEQAKLLELKKRYLQKRHELQQVEAVKPPKQQLIELAYYLQPSGKEHAGKKLINTPGGANCLFNAAYLACKLANVALPVGITNPQELRAAVAEKLREKLAARDAVYQQVTDRLEDSDFDFYNGYIYSRSTGEEVTPEAAGVPEFADSLHQALMIQQGFKAPMRKFAATFHITNTTPYEYIDLIAQDGMWAGDLEASVLAEVLGCSVAIHSDKPQIVYGAADKSCIDLYQSDYRFNLLSAEEQAVIHDVVENDHCLVAMLPGWLAQDKLAFERNKKYADNPDEIGRAIEQEIDKDDWLQKMNKDYEANKDGMTPDQQIYWESTFYLLNMLHNPAQLESFLQNIQEQWLRGINQLQFIPNPDPRAAASPLKDIPFHTEYYFLPREPGNLELLKGTIRSLHRDTLNAYRFAKTTNNPRIMLKFLQAPEGAFCIEARVRAIQDWHLKAEEGLQFEDLVQIILANYKEKIWQEFEVDINAAKSLEDLKNIKKYLYIEDIVEFANKYHKGDKAADGRSIANLAEYLQAHLDYDPRPDGTPSIWVGDENEMEAKDPNDEDVLTAEELEQQVVQLNLELAAGAADDLAPDRNKLLEKLDEPAISSKMLQRIAENFKDDTDVLLKILAKDKTDNATLLFIAQNSADKNVHSAIIQHPKVKADSLKAIAVRSREHDLAIVEHANIRDSTLFVIAQNTTDEELRAAIIRHPKVKVDSFQAIAKRSREHDLAIATHKKADNATLLFIAQNSADKAVHSAIIRHPKVKADSLKAIAETSRENDAAIVSHEEADLATFLHIAQHSKDPAILEKLASSARGKANVLAAIAENKAIDARALFAITGYYSSPSAETLLLAAEHAHVDNVILFQIVDHLNVNDIALLAVANNPKTEAATLIKIKDRSPDIATTAVWLAVVKHDKANRDVLRAAVDYQNDVDPTLMQAVLASQYVDDQIIDAVAGRNDILDALICACKKTNNPTLFNMAQMSRDPNVLAAIAKNENARDDTLYYITQISRDPNVLAAIAKNENAGDDTLYYIAQISHDPNVLAAIAKNENAGEYILPEVINKGPDNDLVIAMRKKINPIHLLIILRRTSDPLVLSAIINNDTVDDSIKELAKAKHPDTAKDVLLKMANIAADNEVLDAIYANLAAYEEVKDKVEAIRVAKNVAAMVSGDKNREKTDFQLSGQACAGKNIVNIPGDGNCFYSAVYLAYKIALDSNAGGFAEIAGLDSPDALRQQVMAKLKTKLDAAKDIYTEVDTICTQLGLSFKEGVICDEDGVMVSEAAFINRMLVGNLDAGLSPINLQDATNLAKDLQDATHIINTAKLAVGTYNSAMTVEQYIKAMETNGTWAGELENQIASEVLQCCLGVHSTSTGVPRVYSDDYGNRLDIFHHEGHYCALVDSEIEDDDLKKLVLADPALTELAPEAWITKPIEFNAKAVFKGQEDWDAFKSGMHAKFPGNTEDINDVTIKVHTTATENFVVSRTEVGDCAVQASSPNASPETITAMANVAQVVVAKSKAMEMEIDAGSLAEIQQLFAQLKGTKNLIISLTAEVRANLMREPDGRGFLIDFDTYAAAIKAGNTSLRLPISEPDRTFPPGKPPFLPGFGEGVAGSDAGGGGADTPRPPPSGDRKHTTKKL